jgi:hypothetical protein
MRGLAGGVAVVTGGGGPPGRKPACGPRLRFAVGGGSAGRLRVAAFRSR